MGIVIKDLSEILPSLKLLKMQMETKKDKKTLHKQPLTEEIWKVEMPEKVREKEPLIEPEIVEEVLKESKKEDKVCSINLEEAVIWAEILGEPLSKKRRRKRMEQRYGNQGYAHRG